jgi:hypothetical protein
MKFVLTKETQEVNHKSIEAKDIPDFQRYVEFLKFVVGYREAGANSQL